MTSVFPPAGYSASQPPSPAPTNITLAFVVSQVLSVSDHNQAISLDLELSAEWIDPRLANADLDRTPEFSDDMAVLEESEAAAVWRPRLYFYSLREISLINAVTGVPEFLALDPDSGRLYWWMAVHFVLDCRMDFADYPVDHHACPLVAGSTHRPADVEVYHVDWGKTVHGSSVRKQKLLPFDLEIRPLPADFGSRNTSGTVFSTAGIELAATRRIPSFVLAWYLPTAVLVVVSWIGFSVPAHMVPGRMALLVTNFLMLINVATSYQSVTPEAQSLTALDIWILTSMLFVAAALFEYAWLLRITFVVDEDDDEYKSAARTTLCRRIDRGATVVFAATFSAFVFVYWIYYGVKRNNN